MMNEAWPVGKAKIKYLTECAVTLKCALESVRSL